VGVAMSVADGSRLGVAVAKAEMVAGAIGVTGAVALQATKLNDIVDNIHFMKFRWATTTISYLFENLFDLVILTFSSEHLPQSFHFSAEFCSVFPKVLDC
jgi:hypothetical protein